MPCRTLGGGAIDKAELKPAPTAPCSDVAPPVIDSLWGCMIRRPPEKDRGHRQARLGLSKATWGNNIIATRYRECQGQPAPLFIELPRALPLRPSEKSR